MPNLEAKGGWMKKIYHGLALVAIAAMLASGGLVGYLYAAGRLTPERAEQIAALLREAPAGEADAADGEAADGEEAAAAADEGTAEANTGSSENELNQRMRDEQMHRALGERALRDLVAQRELLNQAMQHLITEEERFEEVQRRQEEELARRRGLAQDEGFKMELATVEKLSPKLVKEHLLLKWQSSPARTVELLNALPLSKRTRILDQFKSPAEVQLLHRILEEINRVGAQEVAPGSGTTGGNET